MCSLIPEGCLDRDYVFAMTYPSANTHEWFGHFKCIVGGVGVPVFGVQS